MRISEGAEYAGAEVNGTPNLYRVKDIFTTYQGSWERGKSPYSPPQWAELDYLFSMRPGGDHHIYVRVLGTPLPPKIVFQSTTLRQEIDSLGEQWANFPVSQAYYSPNSPPWWHFLEPDGQVVYAGGLPEGEHVSFFVVWEPNPDIDEPDKPTTHEVHLGAHGDVINIFQHGYSFSMEVVP